MTHDFILKLYAKKMLTLQMKSWGKIIFFKMRIWLVCLYSSCVIMV